DDPAYPRADHGFRARRGLAEVTAGLERDIQGCRVGALARLPEGIDLGVSLAELLVPAFADDHPVPDHHGPDQRVRLDRSAAPFGQLEGPGHVVVVSHAGTAVRKKTRFRANLPRGSCVILANERPARPREHHLPYRRP